MALTIDHPATIFDMAELGRASTAMHWAVVKEMWSGGQSWAVRDDDRLIGIMGLYPLGDGAEAWFNVHPDAARHMREILRRIRLTLVSSHYPEIVVLCTSKSGSRIARLCGFDFVETVERGEIWHARLIGRRRRAKARQTAGGAAAAADAGGAGAATG